MIQRFSLNEIDALSRQAARGAGYSWGMAEDVGKSVRWLSSYGFSGAEALASLLQRIENHIDAFKPRQINKIWTGNSGFICPIYSGVIVSDQGKLLAQGNVYQIDNVIYPLLALPQIARLSETHGISIKFLMGDEEICCTKEGLALKTGAHKALKVAHITCQISEATTATLLPSAQGRAIPQDTIDTLKHFAQKTYAPATEASRMAGAGAGLTDND